MPEHHALIRKRVSVDVRRVFTVLVLGVTVCVLVLRQRTWHLSSLTNWPTFTPKKPISPDRAVYEMLDAARIGDTASYLKCFSGPLQAQLTQTAKESSIERFSKYLVDQNAALTGIAVSLVPYRKDDEARVRVEYVYRDRNEVQDLYLRSESNAWKIYKVASGNQIKTLIPYGTIVTD
jgi:hypothetical protein